MNDAEDSYQKLCGRADEGVLVSSTEGILGWDQEVNLPKGGVAFRAKQRAYLSGLAHRLATADEVGTWIATCEDAGWAEDDPRSGNVAGWRYEFDRAAALPSSLVERESAASSEAVAAWSNAREKSDFSLFKPHLATMVGLAREKAELWGYDGSPYDACLEGYERGARADEVGKTLVDLVEGAAPILADALERAGSIPRGRLNGQASVHAQRTFNAEVAEAIGFDFGRGRIDTAEHPFCSGNSPGDCRLTTRYDEDDFTSSLFGVLHEAGHGTYEQGLPAEEWGRPLGRAVSLGIHESQSRLWENHVGRSRAFWERWLPRAELFPHISGLSLDEVVASVNRAERSFIRVESDEMTYDLHIYLRFKMERELIEGRLEVDDVPERWNTLFEETVGLEVPDDAHGCLQDIHWSFGLIGYFPTYSLGNLNASQLYDAALESDPAIRAEVSRGEFGGLLAWMRENIHSHGSGHLPNDLVETATGKPLSAEPHLAHLRERYC